MKKIVCTLLLIIPVLFGTTVTARSGDTLKIGVAAMISPKETFKYYREMINYVGRKLGRRVELVQRPTYSEMDNLLKEEKVSAAFVCAGPYVKDKREFGAELLVAPVSYGKPFYHAYIIAHRDSPYNSLESLRGRSFAFTDPKSNTGRIVPTYMVGKRFHKKPEEFFSKVVYSGTHDKSIEMVAKKLVDGASVDSLIYDYAAKTNPRYTKYTKIIEKSPPYGIPPIVVTKGIDPELKERLRRIFLNMHRDPEGREIISKIMIDRFIVPDDKNYDSVREMERWLEESGM